MTLTLIFDLDLNKFTQGQCFQEDWREASTPAGIEAIKCLMSKVKGEGQGHAKGENNKLEVWLKGSFDSSWNRSH